MGFQLTLKADNKDLESIEDSAVHPGMCLTPASQGEHGIETAMEGMQSFSLIHQGIKVIFGPSGVKRTSCPLPIAIFVIHLFFLSKCKERYMKY